MEETHTHSNEIRMHNIKLFTGAFLLAAGSRSLAWPVTVSSTKRDPCTATMRLLYTTTTRYRTWFPGPPSLPFSINCSFKELHVSYLNKTWHKPLSFVGMITLNLNVMTGVLLHYISFSHFQISFAVIVTVVVVVVVVTSVVVVVFIVAFVVVVVIITEGLGQRSQHGWH